MNEELEKMKLFHKSLKSTGSFWANYSDIKELTQKVIDMLEALIQKDNECELLKKEVERLSKLPRIKYIKENQR